MISITFSLKRGFDYAIISSSIWLRPPTASARHEITTIPPPPSAPRWLLELKKHRPELSQFNDMPLRQQRLGDQAAKFIAAHYRHSIFVTIHPNLDKDSACFVRGATSGASNRDVDKLWWLIETLCYRLDGALNDIQHAEYLRALHRLQGIVVFEKHGGPVHAHILLRCTDPVDQFLVSLFLLEMLDNVDKQRKDPRDNRWQREAWEIIQKQGGWSRDLLWTRTSSIITDLAPRATAMVQVVRTDEDRARVCRYFTKTWNDSQGSLASRRSVENYDTALDFRELSEFHSDLGELKPARCHSIERETGALVLDLDKPTTWKQGGRIIR